MDKRDRAAIFRQRLNASMQSAKLSKSALAKATRVDRSTIGQIFSSDGPRMPGGQLLADMALALNVSSDWLLGITDRPEQPGELIESAIALSHAERSSADAQILDWHIESEGYKIRHVPATLPDLLKTDEMVGWEYQGENAEQAVSSTRRLFDWLKAGHSDHEIAFPEEEIYACANGVAYYSTAPRAIRIAQLERIAELCDDLFPKLRIYLFNNQHLFSAPMSVYGPRLGVIYVGRFYLAFRGRERVQSLSEHFDWLVREASVEARDTAQFIRDCIRQAK